jgi:hypothetical protein
MKKPLLTALGSLTILLAAESVVLASKGSDLGIDPSRLFFVYDAPSGNSGEFQLLPNTDKNPLILPCDLELFGGQIDLTYDGGGSTVYPRVAFSFYDSSNTLITSSGYSGYASLGVMEMDVQPMTPNTRQMDGYTPVDSVGMFRDWQFQPSDLPANAIVRMHMNVELWADANHSQAVADANPSNNARDIWVKRECGCN